MIEPTAQMDGFWLNQYVNRLILIQPFESTNLVLKTLVYKLRCDSIVSIGWVLIKI